MDELIRSHAPKRERDFDAAPPAKQRATTNDLSLDRTLDELFAEGGALAGQLRPRKEEDARRLAQRAKQVEFGKNTNGYENYVRAVPKRERKGYQEHPRTPDITQEASKRKFDGIVQAWRRKLHEWDEPAPTAPAPAAAADGGGAAAAAAEHEDVWFRAKVVALRSRYPPIHVKFTATLEGVTHRLALPEPVTAYVNADGVRGITN